MMCCIIIILMISILRRFLVLLYHFQYQYLSDEQTFQNTAMFSMRCDIVYVKTKLGLHLAKCGLRHCDISFAINGSEFVFADKNELTLYSTAALSPRADPVTIVR